MLSNKKLKVAIVDDHQIVIDGIRLLLADKVQIVLEAHSGLDFCKKLDLLQSAQFPNIVLLDIRMPVMDGFETLEWIKQNHSSLKVIILTMYDSVESVLKMVELGADSYLLKSTSKDELLTALNNVTNIGSYYPNWVSEILAKQLRKSSPTLNEREIEYIKLAALDFTPKEISNKMSLSVRTIEGIKASIFSRLNVRTSSGLIAHAVKNKLIDL